jgi:hypothetical protein
MAETPDDRAHVLRLQELEIERMKAEAALRAAGTEGRSNLGVAGISVVSAVVGALASLGAAYVSGSFDTQQADLENQAEASLEDQKFSYDLIKEALSQTSQVEQARRLYFLGRLGLLPTVDHSEVAIMVDENERFLRSGGLYGRALPSYAPAEDRPVGQIQIALNELGACRRDLQVDAVAGPVTVQCLADFLDEDGAALVEAFEVLWAQPQMALDWVQNDKPPDNWRVQLASLRLDSRNVPSWVHQAAGTSPAIKQRPVAPAPLGPPQAPKPDDNWPQPTMPRP